MTDWKSGAFVAEDFTLESGDHLPRAELAYLQAGELNKDGTNAILVTHGFTTGHHFVLPDSIAAEGSWSELVGADKAIDTKKYFVVSANALGSCYGSSGPASIDPSSGKAYGNNFPKVSIGDTVRLQKMCLESLNVKRIHAVAGPSMGGIQAFQWGVQFPECVDRLVVAVSGIKSPTHLMNDRQERDAKIRSLHNWNAGGPFPSSVTDWLIQLRFATLHAYSMDVYLKDQGLTQAEVSQRLKQLAYQWAEGFHPLSLVSLGAAMADYDLTDKLSCIRAKVLLALVDNDVIFPGSEGPETLRLLKSANVHATLVNISSRYGHLGSGIDAKLWSASLKEFMEI